MMADSVFSNFIYGYVTSGRMNSIALLFSPWESFLTEVHNVQRVLDGEVIMHYMSGWGWIILYALAGAAFAVAALLVYRRRQVESAGDVVSVALVRRCSNTAWRVRRLTFGAFLFAFFFRSGMANSAWIALGLMVTCGGAGYCGPDAALQILPGVHRATGRASPPWPSCWRRG